MVDFASMLISEVYGRGSKSKALETEREKWASDPAHVMKQLSHLQRQWVPDEKAKKLGVGAPLEKIEAAMPDDDPRKGLSAEVMNEFVNVLPHAPKDWHPYEVAHAIYSKKLSDKTESIFQYARKQDTNWGVGIGGDKYKLGPLKEHYDKWLNEEKANTPGILEVALGKDTGLGKYFSDQALPHAPSEGDEHPLNLPSPGAYLTAAGMGAAVPVIGAAYRALRKGAAVPGPLPLKIAAAAAMAIPEFMAWDTVTGALRGTEWYKARDNESFFADTKKAVTSSDWWKTVGVDTALGLATMRYGGRAASKVGKRVEEKMGMELGGGLDYGTELDIAGITGNRLPETVTADATGKITRKSWMTEGKSADLQKVVLEEHFGQMHVTELDRALNQSFEKGIAFPSPENLMRTMENKSALDLASEGLQTTRRMGDLVRIDTLDKFGKDLALKEKAGFGMTAEDVAAGKILDAVSTGKETGMTVEQSVGMMGEQLRRGIMREGSLLDFKTPENLGIGLEGSTKKTGLVAGDLGKGRNEVSQAADDILSQNKYSNDLRGIKDLDRVTEKINKGLKFEDAISAQKLEESVLGEYFPETGLGIIPSPKTKKMLAFEKEKSSLKLRKTKDDLAKRLETAPADEVVPKIEDVVKTAESEVAKPLAAEVPVVKVGELPKKPAAQVFEAPKKQPLMAEVKAEQLFRAALKSPQNEEKAASIVADIMSNPAHPDRAIAESYVKKMKEHRTLNVAEETTKTTHIENSAEEISKIVNEKELPLGEVIAPSEITATMGKQVDFRSKIVEALKSRGKTVLGSEKGGGELAKPSEELKGAIERKNVNPDGSVYFQGEVTQVTNEHLSKHIDNIYNRPFGINYKLNQIKKLEEVIAKGKGDDVTAVRSVLESDSRAVTAAEEIGNLRSQIKNSEQYVEDLKLTNKEYNAKRSGLIKATTTAAGVAGGAAGAGVIASNISPDTFTNLATSGLTNQNLSELDPGAAQMAGVSDRVVGALITDAFKGVYKSTNEMFQAFKDMRLMIPKIDPANKYQMGDLQKGVTIVPDPDPSKITARRKKLPMFFDMLMTPFGKAQIYYGKTEGGREMLTNPMVSAASHYTAAINNTEHMFEVVKNITDDIPGFANESKMISKEMAGLNQEYALRHTTEGYSRGTIADQSKIIASAEKTIKKRSSTPEDIQIASEALREAQIKVKIHSDMLKENEGFWGDFNKRWEMKMQDLTDRSSSARISLAVEDTSDFTKYPWLRDKMTRDELIATGRFKKLNEQAALNMKEQGMPTIEDTPYMHHAAHPDTDFMAIKKELDKMAWEGGDEAYRLAKFHSRSANSLQMMPDVTYIYSKYIPDYNRRLQWNDFWKPGEKNGWAAHANNQYVQNSEGLKKFWDGFKRGFDPVDISGTDKLARRMYDFEIARLLALSPSVAFKHAMKLEANWSNFGIGESAKILPKSIDLLRRMRFTKDVPQDLETTAARSFTNQGRIYQTALEYDTFEVPQKTWDNMMQKWNDKGSILVDTTERFDRGHSFLAASEMALKQGMTPAQAAYGIYDTIMKTNFLSGPMNPAWLRDPKIRMMMMFQGTPFKILEQRAIQAYRAGQGAKGTWETLQALKSEIKEGENLFKMNLIMDGLKRERDIFGTPVTMQMMRKMLIIGSVVMGGKMAFDADLWSHFSHPPFLKFQQSEFGLAAMPVAQAAHQAYGKERGEDDYFVSDFFNAWLKDGLLQAQFIKANRLSKDDIPERYKDSSLKYLFGIPAIAEKKK